MKKEIMFCRNSRFRQKRETDRVDEGSTECKFAQCWAPSLSLWSIGLPTTQEALWFMKKCFTNLSFQSPPLRPTGSNEAIPIWFERELHLSRSCRLRWRKKGKRKRKKKREKREREEAKAGASSKPLSIMIFFSMKDGCDKNCFFSKKHKIIYN